PLKSIDKREVIHPWLLAYQCFLRDDYIDVFSATTISWKKNIKISPNHSEIGSILYNIIVSPTRTDILHAPAIDVIPPPSLLFFAWVCASNSDRQSEIFR
ncbi:hypothetical protein, partial [Porphyromonas gulae]|uniref:hypothetical protein n=1 Tax=Porphyromonas gulae TaxID=111105 RepID=UPI0026EB8441